MRTEISSGSSTDEMAASGVLAPTLPPLTILLYAAPGLSVTTDVVPLTAVDGKSRVGLDDLLTTIVRGLELAQRGPTKSRAQALAITKLEEAQHWLAVRDLLGTGSAEAQANG